MDHATQDSWGLTVFDIKNLVFMPCYLFDPKHGLLTENLRLKISFLRNCILFGTWQGPINGAVPGARGGQRSVPHQSLAGAPRGKLANDPHRACAQNILSVIRDRPIVGGR